MTLTVGSLFSGIGGLDLGLERAGMKVIWQSEIDPYCNKVLRKHWPEVTNHGNIKDINWGDLERPDVICGGYPCQPFSTAGKRKGTNDERYLWGEMLRAIQEIKPQFVVAENVVGITSIDGGLVFQQVCLDLEGEGYEVQPFIIPSCSKNAPHRRDRCWFIASNTNSTNNKTRTYRQVLGQQNRQKTNGLSNVERSNQWQNFPTQSSFCGGDDGLPTELDGITFSKWRKESIKSYGNAIVPQVAYEIFSAIEKSLYL